VSKLAIEEPGKELVDEPLIFNIGMVSVLGQWF
jgi:hypothetical protein